MATFNYTGQTLTSGAPTDAGVPYNAGNRVYVAQGIIDLTDKVTADGELTAAAVLQVLAIPANTLVMRVDVKVVTAAVGTTLAIDVGDASGANSWDNDINAKATAGTITSSTVGTDAYAVAASMGKIYTTADTIDLTIQTSTDITAGPKLKVFALCVDLSW